MAYDPLDATKNTEPTEYGGSPGLIQPAAMGHDLDAPGNRNVKEQAFIIRFEGKRSAQVMEDLPPTDEHYDAVLELAAKRAETLGEWRLEDAL